MFTNRGKTPNEGGRVTLESFSSSKFYNCFMSRENKPTKHKKQNIYFY